MVEQMPEQQQQNGKDCGLFAIAYAFHAALGDDVTIMHFDISKMRQHLIYCLDREELSPFPMEEDKPLQTCDRNHFYISLHCRCLLPKTHGKMVECNICENLYHDRCVTMSVVSLGFALNVDKCLLYTVSVLICSINTSTLNIQS